MSNQTIHLDSGFPVVFGNHKDLGDLAESTWSTGVTGKRVFLVPAYNIPVDGNYRLEDVRELTGPTLAYYHRYVKTILEPIMEGM